MRWRENPGYLAQRRMWARFRSAGSELDRKYWMALGLYGILAALAWFTLGEGSIRVGGKLVELRLAPLLILGLFAFRTYLARHADRIRRENAEGGK